MYLCYRHWLRVDCLCTSVTGTGYQWIAYVNVTGTDYQWIAYVHVTSTGYKWIAYVHVTGTGYQWIAYVHVTGTGYEWIAYVHVTGTGYECIAYVHVTGIGYEWIAFVHITGTQSVCGCTITATNGLPMYTLQALKTCGCTMTAASGLPMYITTYYRHSKQHVAVQSPPLCQPVPDRRSACVSDARLYVDRLLAEEAGLLQRTAAVELRQVAAREVRQQLVRLLRPALSSHQLLDHLAPERRVRENVFLRNKTHHLVQVDIIHLPSKAPALRSVTYR